MATDEHEDHPKVRIEDYTIPLRGGGTAVLSLPVPLSSRDYNALSGWLEWAKASLVPGAENDSENGNGGA